MPNQPLPQPVRVIVRLPYNRPDEDVQDPPRIEWNAEKENILWEVIARSRATDSGGTDWQGLSAHLQVPLPYLLYRAQRRYEQDLQGLQSLQGALSPTSPLALGRAAEDEMMKGKDRPDLIRRISGRKNGSSGKLTSSLRIATPLGIRARLNSLGYDSPTRQSKASSSSTLTLQAPNLRTTRERAPSCSSDSQSESDEENEKAEEEERRLEEADTLDKKLKDLQKAMTTEALGLVREPRRSTKGKEPERGRHEMTSPKSPSRLRHAVARSLSTSESASGTTSPQGSIPSIPSPTAESQPQSPISRHLSPVKKTSSPPTVSAGNARGQSHMQYRPVVTRTRASDKSSNQGSNASSFSDISETSVSASALESALLSNIRGGGSRLSAFARSQFVRRASSSKDRT